MIIFYILNLLSFPIIFIFSAIYFTRYFRLSWLNPLTAVAGAFLPSLLLTSFTGPAVMLEDGLFNPYFQYALLVNNVHEALSTLSLILIVRLFTKNPGVMCLVDRVSRSGGLVNPERMQLAANLFLALYFVSFLLLAQHSFSVVQWVADPRTGYQAHREGAGQWYAIAITALSVSIALMATYQRSTRHVLILAPIYIYLSYLLGSKGLIVNFAIYLVIMLSIRQYRYLRIITIAVGFGATVLVFSSLFSALGSLNLTSLATYSDGYTNAANYYQKYLQGELPLLHGQLFFTDLWRIVPRALYPEKPYIYGVTLISNVFYPGSAEQTNTPAFATVAYFADFGWLGVLISALLNPGNLLTAFIYALVLPQLKALNLNQEQRHSLFLTYGFLILAAPNFLVFFEFPNDILFFVFIAGSINVINRLRIKAILSNKDIPNRRSPDPMVQN